MDFYFDHNPLMDISKTIAENLAAWMDADPNLNTLKKVEGKAKVGFGTIRRTRNGDGNVTVEKLALIAAAFNRHPAELLYPSEGIIGHAVGSGKTPTYLPALITRLETNEPIPLPTLSVRQKREAEIAELLAQIDDYGLVVILEKCREIAKAYPARVSKTE